jgi:ABC-type Fe3+-hydroxamate transport system substrate-binding protein
MEVHLFNDQMDRSVLLHQWPVRRIVSVVPSQTELLYDLGLGEAVVGITKFCIHPSEWFNNLPRVGGTKTLQLGKIATLNPDVILANKEENTQEQIEALATRYPVWVSDVFDLPSALDMIRSVGELCGKTAEAQTLANEIDVAFAVHRPDDRWVPLRTAYLIWRKPYMAAAGGTFIDDMLRRAGFDNVFAGQQRYPELQLQDLADMKPEVVLLSSEPYPFAEKHIREIREYLPDARIELVDGELFSWYGSRLRLSPHYFAQIREKMSV